MPSAIEIVHITDCHLLQTPGATRDGHDVARCFEAVWSAVCRAHPDLDAIVLGGDLVDDESPAGYRWLDARMAGQNAPVLAVAGNHDASPAVMAECLTHCVVHDTLRLGPWRLIGLNSHVDGVEHGRIGQSALVNLDAMLAADPAPTLLVVHHPPVDVGAAWIDAIGLSDREALAQIVSRRPHVRGLLCGHVHQAGMFRLGNCPVWTTPSTMRQFAPGSTEFAEDTSRTPGYRYLSLAADGNIATTVHRLPRADPT